MIKIFSNNNYIMTLLEDMHSGKYNLVLFGIIIVLFYHCYWVTIDKTPEYFGAVTSSSPLQETIPSTLQVAGIISESEIPSFNNTIYYANIDDVQKVAGVIKKIESDGLIFNGKIKEGGNVLIPKGSIIMWSGVTIPNSWTLCDGQNGTPDLRGRFVLGVGQGQGLSNRDVNQKGGFERVQLSAGEIPSHTHDIVFRSDNDAQPNAYTGTAPVVPPDLRKASANNTVTSSAEGNGQSHENMPPFYVLAYIMKL